MMFQLRIYTLRSAEALNQYATINWARHIPTFQGFGVTTHGVWTERGGNANRLVALIAYPNGADPAELASEVMASPEFAADMDGFDPQDIVAVDFIPLDATGSSPIQ
jgi:NIPSNAP